MMSFAVKLMFLAVLLFVGVFSLPSYGQTLAQEERFEACCKNATAGAIADMKYCNYRELLLVNESQFGNAWGLRLERGVKIARDGNNTASVNEAWADFLPCLNNGKDNRECCYASSGDGIMFKKACTPLCNGLLLAKDVDIDALDAEFCYHFWKPIVRCAIKAA